MATVRRSPRAAADLEAILDHLSCDDPNIAARYATEFHQKARFLERFPESGRSRPEIAPNLRSSLVRPYVIFYRIDDDSVQILRILDGRMDVRSVLRAEDGD